MTPLDCVPSIADWYSDLVDDFMNMTTPQPMQQDDDESPPSLNDTYAHPQQRMQPSDDTLDIDEFGKVCDALGELHLPQLTCDKPCGPPMTESVVALYINRSEVHMT